MSILSPQEIAAKYTSVLNMLREIAETYHISARREDAVNVLAVGLALLHEVSPHHQAIFLTSYGKQLTASVFQSKRTADEALSVLSRAKQLAESLGEQVLLANVLYELGELYFVRGHKTEGEASDYDTALSYMLHALDLFEAEHDEKHMPQASLGVGRMYQNRGQNEAAQLYIERALEQAEQQQNKAIWAEAINHLALLTAGVDDIETALQHAKTAITIRESAGLKAEIPYSYLTLAELYQAEGKNAEALATYQQCYTLSEEIQSTATIFVLLGIGYIHLEKNNTAEAIKHFEQALTRAEAIGLRTGIQEAQEALAEAKERVHV